MDLINSDGGWKRGIRSIPEDIYRVIVGDQIIVVSHCMRWMFEDARNLMQLRMNCHKHGYTTSDYNNRYYCIHCSNMNTKGYRILCDLLGATYLCSVCMDVFNQLEVDISSPIHAISYGYLLGYTNKKGKLGMIRKDVIRLKDMSINNRPNKVCRFCSFKTHDNKFVCIGCIQIHRELFVRERSIVYYVVKSLLADLECVDIFGVIMGLYIDLS